MDKNYKKINKLRNKTGCALALTIFLTVSVFLTFIILNLRMPDSGFIYFGAFLTLFTGVILYYAFYNPQKKKYIKLYKNEIVRNCLDSVFQDVVYEPQEFFDIEVIQRANLIQFGNSFKGDDKITAKYKGVQFSLCNLKIMDIIPNRRFREEIIHFFGTWIILDFCSKSYFENSKNKMTRDYMNALSKLQALTEGIVLNSFVDNKLHIAINNHVNTFEPPSSDSIENYHDFVMTEILFITEIIDELI
jgi:hypothetical protein